MYTENLILRCKYLKRNIKFLISNNILTVQLWYELQY